MEQSWGDMLNWGLCRSFLCLRGVPLGTASYCSSAVAVFMVWDLGLLQKHPSR